MIRQFVYNDKYNVSLGNRETDVKIVNRDMFFVINIDKNYVIVNGLLFNFKGDDVERLIKKSELLNTVTLKQIDKNWSKLILSVDKFEIPTSVIHVFRYNTKDLWKVYYTDDDNEMLTRPKNVSLRSVYEFEKYDSAKSYALDYSHYIISGYNLPRPDSFNVKYE